MSQVNVPNNPAFTDEDATNVNRTDVVAARRLERWSGSVLFVIVGLGVLILLLAYFAARQAGVLPGATGSVVVDTTSGGNAGGAVATSGAATTGGVSGGAGAVTGGGVPSSGSSAGTTSGAGGTTGSAGSSGTGGAANTTGSTTGAAAGVPAANGSGYGGR